ARPGEALAPDADAVARRLAGSLDEVEMLARRVDHDRAGWLRTVERDGAAQEFRVDLRVVEGPDWKALIGETGIDLVVMGATHRALRRFRLGRAGVAREPRRWRDVGTGAQSSRHGSEASAAEYAPAEHREPLHPSQRDKVNGMRLTSGSQGLSRSPSRVWRSPHATPAFA